MREFNLSGWFASKFVNSKLTPLFIIASMLAGWFAIATIPREEEPQIVVPMVDVFAGMPGASAEQVEQRVMRPLEKLLWEIPGVEYVYTTSSEEQGMAIVRFKVGEDLERSLVKITEKLEHHKDRIPPGVVGPLVRNRTIDDVPFLALTFWSRRYDHYDLRRVAAQVMSEIKAIPDVSVTNLIGGMPRSVTIHLDPIRMSGYGVSPFELQQALSSGNRRFSAGEIDRGDVNFTLMAGTSLATRQAVEDLVVAVRNGRPVRLRELASVTDGPAETDNYTFISFGPGAGALASEAATGPHPAVTLAVSKRQGTNAIVIAGQIFAKLEVLRQTVIPPEVEVQITRDYGQTAAEKASDLFSSMRMAIGLVVAILLVTLGFRPAMIASVSIPVTLALVMVSFVLTGFTLNRITLFAMIFSIGLLTDDAVVVLENILRHSGMKQNRGRDASLVAYDAVAEIGNPTILANIAIVLGVLPMALVSGMMGPYMSPIPIGTAAAAMLSLLVAYVVSPWAAIRLLGMTGGTPSDPPVAPPSAGPAPSGGDSDEASVFDRFYRRIITPLVRVPRYRMVFSVVAILLVLGAAAMVPLRLVKVKMLPFDNKSEFQVIVDMPEGATLERTAAATRAIAGYLETVPEVKDVEQYVGLAGPYNFSGLVRHYFLRKGANVADLQVNLVGKDHRTRQSHEIAKAVREPVQTIGERFGANVKIAEVPPGPPVLQTLVVEVYGPTAEVREQVASQVLALMYATPGVVDIDTYTEADQRQLTFEVDQAKAALVGLTPEQIAAAIRMGVAGAQVGLMDLPAEREDVAILVRLPRSARANPADLLALRLPSAIGDRPVPLSEVVTVREKLRSKSIYHKNLQSVVYLTADVAGSEESPVYPILQLVSAVAAIRAPGGAQITQWHARMPFETTSGPAVKFDGEWQITIEVFRDLGLAFAAVMILIYVLMVGWYQDFVTPIGILLPVPFSLVGILPGHWALGAFFTATSMIGFIAGAGIIVRNSLLLIDFIVQLQGQGLKLEDAVIEAAVIRFRPMVLTSLSTLIGAIVMVFDPIFQGLGIAIVFGEIASTCVTRVAVPVIFYQIERLRGRS